MASLVVTSIAPALMLLTLMCSGTYANNSDAAKNALAKAQYMLRQVSAEKAALEKEVNTQKEKLDTLLKENSQIKLELKNSKLAVNPQDEVVKVLKENGQQIQSKFQEQAKINEQLSDKNTQLEARLTSQNKNFDVCYSNNKKLYAINKEILGQYENKGFWDALKQREPFTSLERVKVENLVQDYQYDIESLSVNIIQADRQ